MRLVASLASILLALITGAVKGGEVITFLRVIIEQTFFPSLENKKQRRLTWDSNI